MSEFQFRTLSVKLMPEAPVVGDAVCICCSYEFECGECTHCTDTPTDVGCSPCTNTPTDVCGECTDSPTGAPECGPCTDGPTDACFPCTDFGTGPECRVLSNEPCRADTCGMDTGCFDTITIVVPPPTLEGLPARAPRPSALVKLELAVLREELRLAMGAPRRAPKDGKPRTVEELESLRGALLDAVAELDELRDQFEADRPQE